MHLLFRGIYPAGGLAGGALAQAIGVRNTMLIGAAGILCSIVLLIPVRTLVGGGPPGPGRPLGTIP